MQKKPECHPAPTIMEVWLEIWPGSLEDKLLAGVYDQTNSVLIDGAIPVNGQGFGRVKVYAIVFERRMTSEDVEVELRVMGKKPAMLDHLLAFGAKLTEFQRYFPVLALGSKLDKGMVFIPLLCELAGKRVLTLHSYMNAWDPDCCFLAVDL